MDLERMSQGQRIAGAGGVLLILFLFLPWFGVEGKSFSGWNETTYVYFLITGLVAIVTALTAGAGRALPGTTLSGSTALLGLVATIVAVWSIFDAPGLTSPKIGLYLGVIASGAVGFGGLRAAAEEQAAASHYY